MNWFLKNQFIAVLHFLHSKFDLRAPIATLKFINKLNFKHFDLILVGLRSTHSFLF